MNKTSKIVFENDALVIEEDFEDVIDDSLLAAFENSDFDKPSTSKNDSNNRVNTSKDLDISDLNISALCCDEELNGYDKLTGKKWIYPINYPQRDYQFNIIKAAIVKNTLVSLPTGLGKTFIAAVLMYNFYRWYPLGKIVFTAPTRPLIAQQMEACYNIIAMPPGDTIEMTGTMPSRLREENWQKKRVFFATPQVVCNDIRSGICPANRIRCLVVDEAHKAKSNYAYCQIVSLLNDREHRMYRVLALSATPGSRIEDVIKVVQNLQIAHLELRSENCIDVAPYCQTRKINTVVIELGPELTKLRHQYIEIMDGYARKLKQMNILPANLGNLSKGRMAMLYKEFKNKPQGHPQNSYIMKDMTQLITLYHGLELLVKHGARSFLNFFDEHPEKAWIQADDRLTAMLERLRDDLGVNPLTLNTDFQPDGTIPEVPNNLNFGHPKFAKLKEIMMNHFQKAKENGQDTRAIVFCEYHETVKLVHCLLLQCRPLIKPRKFVGQGAGGKAGGKGGSAMSQGEQARALAAFRAGACSALVATCVAEEGLDVGGVDLILCFDVASRSPVRLVQRCGRTGRERSGQVYFLVTEGKEHQTLQDGMRQRDGLNNRILHSKEVENNLYKLNPRMIPHDFTPVCEKMYITVNKREPKRSKKGSKGDGKITTKNVDMQNAMQIPTPSTSATSQNAIELMTEDNSSKDPRQIQKQVICDDKPNTQVAMETDDLEEPQLPKSDLQPKKSRKTDTRRLSTANTKTSSPIKKISRKNKEKQPVKKNCDIRALFSKGTSTQTYTKALNELGIQNENMPAKLVDLLVKLSIENNTSKTCYICDNICDCRMIHDLRKYKTKSDFILNLDREPTFLDINLIDHFDSASILKCITDKPETTLCTSTTCHVIEEDRQPTLEKKTLVNNTELGNRREQSEERDIVKIKCNNSNNNQHVHSSFELGTSDDILYEDEKSEGEQREDNVYELCSSKSNQATVPMGMRSPSIISGSRTNALDFNKSPILGSQKARTKTPIRAVDRSTRDSGIDNPSNSMLTITQTIDLINDYDDSVDITRCGSNKSPILHIQADKKKMTHDKGYNKSVDSSRNVIIISSGSDTDEYDYTQDKNEASTLIKNQNKQQQTTKFKHETDNHTTSPYFSKKLKLKKSINNYENKATDTVLADLTSNYSNKEEKFQNNVTSLNMIVSYPKGFKENIYQNISKSEIKTKDIKSDIKKETNNSYLGNIYCFSPKISYTMTKPMEPKIKSKSKKLKLERKRIVKDFLDLEAELSQDGASGSGDEMSDDSVGSIVDFITDKDVTYTNVDMQAHYIKSVKSPIKHGAFKIPEIPKKKDNIDVFSEFIEEDAYEMDSFCVDSHVGLTQANDLSQLELAEMILEQKRKRKKKSRIIGISNETDSSVESSPETKPKNKKAKRYNVLSDSDDDS